ncbi:MAG: tRNA (adenine(22)-N(1))-methyltransferase TrmK, partial [Lachnospiraceae bacterium]
EGKSRKVDTLLMAGMGGRLMIHILQEGKPISEQTAEWILQPQSEISLVRQYIRTQQYHISEENMVLEDGKYYVMMKAEPKQLPGTVSLIPMQLCDAYGEYLLQNQHPVLRQYLYARRTHLLGLMQTLTEEGKPSAKLVTRLSELTQEAAQIELALTYFT